LANPKVYKLFPLSDDSLISAWEQIAQELNVTQSATVSLHLAGGPPLFGPQHSFSEFLKDENVRLIRDSKAVVLERAFLKFSINGQPTTIDFRREQEGPHLTLTVQDNQTPADSLRIHLAVGSALAKHDRLIFADTRLGDELREFELRREGALHRLEEIARETIRRNDEHIKALELRHDEERRRLREQHEKSNQELQKKYEAQQALLAEQEERIAERISALDDRNNTHARREIHKNLKKALEDRNIKFGLTRQTNRKRWPIHALFSLLILSATSATLFYGSRQLESEVAAGSFASRSAP
jgi:hypothetical protein